MTAAVARGRGVALSRLAAAVLLLLGLFCFRHSLKPSGYNQPTTLALDDYSSNYDTPLQANDTHASKEATSIFAESCRSAPGADKVFLILKTGATEIYSKLPVHLLTLLQCVPHFMLFSDLAQTFADRPVHDALSSVSQAYRDHHPNFELYRKLAQYAREGQDMGTLRGGAGWDLDKWKFLPMIFEAFEAAPKEVEWFVMIEADTSLSWGNLLLWLKTMKANKPWYLGSQVQIGESVFAHGGSGFVVSRKAATLLQKVRQEEGRQAYDQRWEQLTAGSCCGDEIVGRALLEAGVPLTRAWPILQGETVATLDWTKNHWCSPALTWHHVSPTEVDTLWQFQSEWVEQHGWRTPYLYRDIFAQFVQRHVTVNRTSWNNMSDGQRYIASNLTTDEDGRFEDLSEWEKQAVESQDACASVCTRFKQCVQWMYRPGRCYLGNVVRFGKSDEMEAEHWTSGWMSDRLDSFQKALEGCVVR